MSAKTVAQYNLSEDRGRLAIIEIDGGSLTILVLYRKKKYHVAYSAKKIKAESDARIMFCQPAAGLPTITIDDVCICFAATVDDFQAPVDFCEL